VKILVTGAAGFVGSALLPRLLSAGHEVVGTRLPGEAPPEFLPAADRPRVRWLPLDLRENQSVRTLAEEQTEAVIHLAALASGAEARRDPGLAWEVNAGGTARLADALGGLKQSGKIDPLFLLISSAEVYGAIGETRLRTETDVVAPISPYASSKAGAELALLETARRTGLRAIIARAFPHTGPGQTDRYVVAAFAKRLRAAKRMGLSKVKTGNLEPVRDLLDVRDVADAYLAMLERGKPGETYNVASGVGRSLQEVFDSLAEKVGVQANAEPDSTLVRTADIPHLVGDATRLRHQTGWAPRISFDQTLQDLLNAQTD
jgi:GDP-4-dehydro-6-deoxy-D-mannose reductase